MTAMSGQPTRTNEDIEAQIAQIQQQREERPDDDNEDIQKENKRIRLGDDGGMLDSDIHGATSKTNLEGQHDTIGGNEEDEEDAFTLPKELLNYVMMMVGVKSLDDLHTCRQVCGTWNEFILSFIWGSNGSMRIMKEKIERSWGHGMLPSDEEIRHAKWLEAQGILSTEKIREVTERLSRELDYNVSANYVGNSMIEELTCSASLAEQGLLGSMSSLALKDVDLSSIPTNHMSSLVASVTTFILIENVSGCDLVNLLTSLKCDELVISRQSLGEEETRALVQAMESGVESVELERGSTFDMKSLLTYSGQGMCGGVAFWWDTEDKSSIEDAKTWAGLRNWSCPSSVSKFGTFVKMNLMNG